jgi:hypothetical protein
MPLTGQDRSNRSSGVTGLFVSGFVAGAVTIAIAALTTVAVWS